MGNKQKVKALMDKKTRDAFLDIYERGQEADAALQEYWESLEAVVNAEILDRLEEVLHSLEAIECIAVAAIGGGNALIREQYARADEEGSDPPEEVRPPEVD